MSEAMFYQSIGNSIQANKDKIEKLEKQNTRLKKQKKVLQQENKQLKEIIEEVRELIPKQLLSNVNITKYTDEMCLRDILKILDKAKENK